MSQVEVLLMIGFGIFGYLSRKFQFELAPMVLALVLGPMMENNLRLSLITSYGDPFVFIKRPISAAFIGVSLLLLLFAALPRIRKRREMIR
jgi:putative tricarboxylic transport membrane protein